MHAGVVPTLASVIHDGVVRQTLDREHLRFETGIEKERPGQPIARRRAGLPATSAYAGTSAATTLPAATSARSPTVTPHTMVALAPIEAPTRTRVGRN